MTTKTGKNPLDENDKIICHNVNRLRKEKSMTISDLSAWLCCSFAQTQKICCGKNRLKASDLKKLSEFWRVDINEFFKPI